VLPRAPVGQANLGGAVTTLQLDEDADTLLVWGRRGFYGGYRGFYGGYRGFYGGYRGFYGGYYPRYYSYGGYYPRYYGGYYPGYYNYYYPRYYYNYYPSYYWGCSLGDSLGNAGVVTVLGGEPQPAAPAQASPQPQPSQGNYPYDGGPANPVPLPGTEPKPATPPQPTVPLEGRVVSLPSKPGKYVYPAYGEQFTRTSAPSGTVVKR
jgi:hypothetical protein